MADTSVEMDAETRDELLGRGGIGVISLSTPDKESPHSIPVSYGYDATETTLYFRLAVGADSGKGELNGRDVSFVTYDRADGWRSVVANGRLEDVDEESIATETLEGLDRVDIPLVDMFDEPTRTVSFEFFRLVPEEISGRKEADIRE
ncbi:pyridoxamine 5'-phosphate oxidase [Halalkalicoccus paucihalophilus]|jgi:uncharacterized protein|uniref:Pyridoxamine 5'-phosphate oxidase n=1 Tax=Halalkalicoccus paucihalophilus TaxID=1008153 RepID=A0A151AEC5_9EURY|nr:pyridoxamine 5'-phosphate oxidase family protein [Halalkalicoccus paucihalophilus]KYH25924.1 pyridoxamine 5'-phosphate oxidase [Halalkalicoccus paucihalophilus]